MEVLGIVVAGVATVAAVATLPPAAAVAVGGCAAIVSWKLGRRVRSRRALRKTFEAQELERREIAAQEAARVDSYRLTNAPRELARQLDAPLSAQLTEFMSLAEHWRCATEDGTSIDVHRNRRSIRAVQGICLKIIDGCPNPEAERERLAKALRHLSGQLAAQLVRTEQAGLMSITLDLKLKSTVPA